MPFEWIADLRPDLTRVGLSRVDVDRVDWFKVDSQGTDLRLFNSLSGPVRERVLCVEVEPGLIDVYKGEDLFVEAHRNLIDQGFWLSEARVSGTARMRRSSEQHLRRLQPSFDSDAATERCPTSPGWVEATYMRSIEHFEAQHRSRAICLLWSFALFVANGDSRSTWRWIARTRSDGMRRAQPCWLPGGLVHEARAARGAAV